MANRYGRNLKFLLVLSLISPGLLRADDSQLLVMVENLQRQMAELRQTVEKQNAVIEILKGKVEQNGGPVTVIPAKESKPAGRKDNLKHYLFGKPEALPKEGELHDVKAGMGDIKMGLLLQEWYTFTDERAHSNFRTRRLELGFSGKLMDHLKWTAVIDPSEVREDNTQRSILKDAFLSFDGIPHHEIKLGQYKIPVTEEGFRIASGIDTLERSFIGRTFGDKRDIGLMALGKWNTWITRRVFLTGAREIILIRGTKKTLRPGLS